MNGDDWISVVAMGSFVVAIVGVAAVILWASERRGVFGRLGCVVLLTLAVIAGGILLFGSALAFYDGFIKDGVKIEGPQQFILPAVIFYFLGSWIFWGGSGIENQDIDFEAPELQNATRLARETLPTFIERVLENTDQAYLKFPFHTDGGVTEHVWGYVHTYHDDSFNVTIVSELIFQEAEFDARRDVPQTDVKDWQIMHPDDSIEGAYSIRGAFEYLERKGKRLNRTMRKQKAQLK